jgi:hypothetical protein
MFYRLFKNSSFLLSILIPDSNHNKYGESVSKNIKYYFCKKLNQIEMVNKLMDPIGKLMGLRYKSHPWHGVDIGNKAPDILTCYIEMVPTDTVKYEVDKKSGYLKLDRPQKYSNVVPALYGFIPQTFS